MVTGMKYITVFSKQGNKQTIVDDEDFKKLNRYRWSFVGRGYACRGTSKEGTIYMHRMLMKARKGQQVDHINNNKLDNCKANLRIANNFQNNVNQGLRKTNTSGYKGVYWHNQLKRWGVLIRVGNGKRLSLGTYNDPKVAAKVYNKAALKYHGEFAVLNEVS
jgi:hypothetical protein